MNKLKLMTIVGTRPEIIKMAEIIKKCDEFFDHILVHTGQNYDYQLNDVFFKDLGLKAPDYYLGVVGENLGQTMGNVISKSYELMSQINPDAVIVLGDTNSCLSVIPAKRLKIPIFHMEAGNRCKDENLPEEVIRRIVDVTSDINLCYSEHARKYILDSGVRPEYTFVVGSPMAEVLGKYEQNINESDILNKLGLKRKGYILLSAHREENIDIEKNFFSLMNSINDMAKYFNMPILYSCHPRSEKYISQRKFIFDKNIIKHKPLGFFDYNQLQKNAFCVISDSGTLPEESAYLHFPAVSIRTSTERPEALDSGVFIIGSITSESIIQSVIMATKLQSEGYVPSPVEAYNDRNVSSKVIRLIQSYTQIVNKMIWRK
ncbi:MAG: UDP-N-acetylglucosamine 2-epimerase (non-hydrolyzing) [Muribaculaceae bacterium]|nr:UDP-N-acetylglucosamine 2-epimerase (non-hydrolyzing) [Muribaculaceae bacterium]